MIKEETTQALEERAAVAGAERLIQEARRKTRKRFSTEDKIRIALKSFRREIPVSDLCRREEIEER